MQLDITDTTDVSHMLKGFECCCRNQKIEFKHRRLAGSFLKHPVSHLHQQQAPLLSLTAQSQPLRPYRLNILHFTTSMMFNILHFTTLLQLDPLRPAPFNLPHFMTLVSLYYIFPRMKKQSIWNKNKVKVSSKIQPKLTCTQSILETTRKRKTQMGRSILVELRKQFP